MLIRSKRRTHSQIGGSEAGETRLNAGGRPVGVESAVGVAGGVPNPAQEVSANNRMNPNKWVSTDFISSVLPNFASKQSECTRTSMVSSSTRRSTLVTRSGDGLTASEAAALRERGYNPRDIYNSHAELRQALDMIGGGFFSPDEPGRFRPIFDGNTLKGWHLSRTTHHGSTGNVFVENGEILMKQKPYGQGGLVLTDKRYHNFELYLEVKEAWGCNSGIFLQGEDYQCEDTFRFLMDYRIHPDELTLQFVVPPDCNGNHIPDDEDIANGTSADDNKDSVPDECEAK